MTCLFIRTRRMELGPNYQELWQLKSNIQAYLNNLDVRFTDVINNDQEVAGNLADMRVSILHLHIGGRGYFEQVIASGTDVSQTRGIVDRIANDIAQAR
ncbi:hypothetical protein BKA15_005896 [Microlunatus parietis]|uniref:Uncharacterized protein n=2 Tax=Microlunatus parietis TaxID=682979 RepID=A0A7Y9LE44_9ACTN|nr:hypothetical protein [Microlunatus parietis]